MNGLPTSIFFSSLFLGLKSRRGLAQPLLELLKSFGVFTIAALMTGFTGLISGVTFLFLSH